MANSDKHGPHGGHHRHRHHRHTAAIPPKAPIPPLTPGVRGHADSADPTWTTLLGYTTTAITGVRDWADHTLHEIEDWAQKALGSVGVDKHTRAPMAVGPKPPAISGGLDLGFLGEYVGGEITRQDILTAATELKCEPGLIYAIAKQESATSSFIRVDGRTVPTILYERHVFRRYTSPHLKPPSPYEHDHPDICGPAYHRTHRGKGAEKGLTIDNVTKKVALPDDIYGPTGHHQYERLCKAYALDRGAALEACSWGKFQLMGFNYKTAGYADVFAFVKGMSTGDPAHIKAFLKFAKSNPTLLKGLQDKNFVLIAEGHNGKDWASVNPDYPANLEKYSKEWK
jgi:hypothetical protein